MNRRGVLNGKKVAALVSDGFEQVELTSPLEALKEAGAQVSIVSNSKPRVKGWQHTKWGDEFKVDRPLVEARADDFDALLVPGGLMSPDRLRIDPNALRFMRDFFDAGKPVAAICHGPWVLINAGVVVGRRVTSYPSIRVDLENAGAEWIDASVVVDNGLVTSRSPADLQPFNEKMIEEFSEGSHPPRNSAEAIHAL